MSIRRYGWTAVVTMLLATVGCGGGTSGRPEPQKEVPAPATVTDEASAIAALKKIGARIDRDEKKPGKPVVQIALNGPKVTDEALKGLKYFKDLSTLFINSDKVTDAGMKELKDLKSLVSLNLGSTAV